MKNCFATAEMEKSYFFKNNYIAWCYELLSGPKDGLNFYYCRSTGCCASIVEGPKDGLNFYYCRYPPADDAAEGPKDGLNFYYCRFIEFARINFMVQRTD